MISVCDVNILLKEIEKEYKLKSNQNIELFPKYRFHTGINDLCLNAFARVLCNLVNKTEPNDIFSVYFYVDKSSSSNKKEIKKISITSNLNQKGVKDKMKTLIEFLQHNSTKNLNTNIIKAFFEHILEKEEVVGNGLLQTKQYKKTTKLSCNLGFKDSDDFFAKLEGNEITGSSFKKLAYFQDLVLIFLSKDYYNYASVSDDVFTYKSIENMHSETLLAITNSGRINEYIGISKLCCPFCQKVLQLLGFSFRGGHNRYYNCLNNWEICVNNNLLSQDLLNNDFIKNIYNWLFNVKEKLHGRISLNEIFSARELEAKPFDTTRFYKKYEEIDDIKLLYNNYFLSK